MSDDGSTSRRSRSREPEEKSRSRGRGSAAASREKGADEDDKPVSKGMVAGMLRETAALVAKDVSNRMAQSETATLARFCTMVEEYDQTVCSRFEVVETEVASLKKAQADAAKAQVELGKRMAEFDRIFTAAESKPVRRQVEETAWAREADPSILRI